MDKIPVTYGEGDEKKVIAYVDFPKGQHLEFSMQAESIKGGK